MTFTFPATRFTRGFSVHLSRDLVAIGFGGADDNIGFAYAPRVGMVAVSDTRLPE